MIKNIIEEKWPDTEAVVRERWFYHTLQSLSGDEIKNLLELLNKKNFKKDEVEKIIKAKFEGLIKEYE